jgi:DNA-binding NtrC family response regulator
MREKFKMLLVEDDLYQRESLGDVLAQRGYPVTAATSGEEALEMLSERSDYKLALVDLRLPNMGGLDLLKAMKPQYPEIEVIVITGYGSIKTAVDAMKLGAVDYLEKPVVTEELLILLEREYKRQLSEDRSNYLMAELSDRYQLENIVGGSTVMKQVIEQAQAVSSSDASVLITGESGTGKELIAHHIHYASPRRKGKLIKVSCAAFAPGLIESELFGHEKWAYTSAMRARKGRFEMANMGTIFLDEISDIPFEHQAKLLRVLQFKEFEKVGGSTTIKSNFRIITATNHRLEEDVEKGEFRKDLYYRLMVVEIEVPPLRQRKEDIRPLLKHFITIYETKTNKRIRGNIDDTVSVFEKHDWPGNVRELKNVVERAFALYGSSNKYLDTKNLPLCIQSEQINPINSPHLSTRRLDDVEKALIEQCLTESRGNKTHAAKLLDIARTTLNSKIEKHNIKV